MSETASPPRAGRNDDIASLDEQTRRRLVQLACVGAWSDMSVAPEERQFVLQLCAELALGPRGCDEVQRWLDGPPPDFDPNEVLPEHRALFLRTLERVVEVDGRIDPDESETLRLIRELFT